MFRRISISLVSIGLPILLSFAHPYHLSVTTLKCSSSEKTLQAEIKIFYHDLEPAVNAFGGTEIDIKHHEDKKLRDSLVFAYMNTRFNVTIDGNRITWDSHKLLFVDEYALIQLRDEGTNGKKMVVKNTMCFETESTQTNLFHLLADDRPKQTKKTVNPEAEVNFVLP